MMNCDGFRPIARTKVGRYGNMGGNAGIPLVPIRDEGFILFNFTFSVSIHLKSVETWVAPRKIPAPIKGWVLFIFKKYINEILRRNSK